MNLTRRELVTNYTCFMGYSLARAGYKCTQPIVVRTERAEKVRQYPLLYREYEPYKDETRPLLLTEKAGSVAATPFTTLYRFREDLEAFEVILRDDSPEKFNLEGHPIFNKVYKNVQDFITS